MVQHVPQEQVPALPAALYHLELLIKRYVEPCQDASNSAGFCAGQGRGQKSRRRGGCLSLLLLRMLIVYRYPVGAI